MAYDDHVDEMHFGGNVRAALTITEKARRVNAALHAEIETLRGAVAPSPVTVNHMRRHGHTADRLAAILEYASNDTKARLFDLIVSNDTAAGALQELDNRETLRRLDDADAESALPVYDPKLRR